MGYLGAVDNGVTAESRTGAKAIWALALMLGAALLLAACGGDDNGGDSGESTLPPGLTTSSVPQTLTKPDYIARGDQICAAGSFKIGDQARKQFGNAQPTPAQGGQFVRDVIVPTFEEQLAQLRALPAPSGDGQTVAAIYDALEKGVVALKEDPTLFATPAAGGAFERASRLARAYGFKQCGQR